MYLETHGARGSIPVGTAEYVRYGGDTTCYSLHHDDGTLIALIDAGTGLRLLHSRLAEWGAQVPVLFTHYHWDHIQGLSMCSPMWAGDISLRIYGARHPHRALGTAIGPPWFPVSILDADVEFASAGTSFRLGDVGVSTFPLHHPQGGTGYRFDWEDQSVVIATDHEGGTGLDADLVEVAQGAGILVHDAQYLPTEMETKRGWGHSTWEQAAKAAADSGVGQLVLASHDPGRDDDALDRLVQAARESFPATEAASPERRFFPA